MIKGIYSAEAAMRPKMTQMEVLANNLANINSTGFKKDRVFVRMLEESAAGRADGRTDLAGVEAQRAVDFSGGSLRQTGNPLDLAIEGRGFFAVDTPRGMRLTRNGNFKLSPDGTLVTGEGYAVLSAAGHITIPQADKLPQGSVSINEAGEISTGRETIARVRVVDVERTAMLQKDHESLFSPDPGDPVRDIPADQTVIRQGYLEESNVEGIEEMIAMIELSRSFETDQKMIQAQDQSLDRVMEIGRV
jgi:flagellar basal-body rod protein FlgG